MTRRRSSVDLGVRLLPTVDLEGFADVVGLLELSASVASDEPLVFAGVNQLALRGFLGVGADSVLQR
jgi:hypothetical protein